MTQAGLGAYLPLQFSLLFWATVWLATWWLAEVLLWSLERFLRPWNVPLLPEIVLAYTIALFCSAIYVPEIMRLFEPFANTPMDTIFAQLAELDKWQRMFNAIKLGTAGLLMWTISRTLIAALSARSAQENPADATVPKPAPHSSEAPTAEPVSPSATPMTKFQRELLKHGVSDFSLIAGLQAQDHYVEVTLFGRDSVLVLFRFSDAIEDLVSLDGVRIHRSYWVSRQAIAKLDRSGNSMQIELVNGNVWPVSGKYRGHVEHFVTHPPAAAMPPNALPT